MNKIKFVALAMAMVMLALCFAACGDNTEKVTVNCTVSVIVDGEEVFGPYDLAVTGSADNPPTVLQAATEALTLNEIPSEVDDNGLSLKSITIDGTTYATGADDVNIYSWYYTANDVEPESGRAGTNAVQEGQHIKFIYSATAIDPEEFSEEGEGDDGGR